MSRSPRVLVIDDQPRAAELLARLGSDLSLVEVRDSSGAARRHARSFREVEPFFTNIRRQPDLVVLDLKFDLPDEELLPDLRPLGDDAAGRRLRRERRDRQGLLILERLRRLSPDLAVVLTTAYTEIPFEEEALRLAADAFTYAVGEEETSGEGLVRLVRRVLAEREAPLLSGRFFWGKTPAMRELRRRVQALAPTRLPLLITGPTGTGKNLLAREVVHPASGRKGPYVSFDCATVPETLLQAALFGTVRGAFTGAIADRAGVFEAARNGTLFLDEVENLSPEAQKTLLTAINDGKIRRVGSVAEVPHHAARVVAASNVDLSRRATEGAFRPDLLMRLNPALTLDLPPLGERREDLPALAGLVARDFFSDPANRREIASSVRAEGGAEPEEDFFLARGEDALSETSAPVVFALPGKAWAAMAAHPWPGNIRQFEMVLSDVLASALYGGPRPALDRRGRAIFAIDARMVFGLLSGARDATAPAERLVLPRPRGSTVAGFRRELERAAFRSLFHEAGGDFGAMARLMTGSPREARAARLRFNRLGLSVRKEK